MRRVKPGSRAEWQRIGGTLSAELGAAEHAVIAAARALCHSGYDGPFMGEEVEPLFKSVREYDAARDAFEQAYDRTHESDHGEQ